MGHGCPLENSEGTCRPEKKFAVVFPQHIGVGAITCEQEDHENLRTLKR